MTVTRLDKPYYVRCGLCSARSVFGYYLNGAQTSSRYFCTQCNYSEVFTK